VLGGKLPLGEAVGTVLGTAEREGIALGLSLRGELSVGDTLLTALGE
jgi:hypothetical protein